MSIDEPIQNNSLLELIKKSGNLQLTDDVVNEIINAHFLCPVYGENAESKHLYIISDGKEKYLMAFTDWDEYYKWSNTSEHPQAFVMTYYDYIKTMTSIDVKGFVINPYGSNFVIDEKRIQYINKQSSTIKTGEKVAIGAPKEVPVELMKELVRFFGQLNCVNQAYLLWMVRNGESGYLLVLDSYENTELLFPQIAEVSRPFLSGKSLDMLPLSSSFSKMAIENQVPFYGK